MGHDSPLGPYLFDGFARAGRRSRDPDDVIYKKEKTMA